MLKLEEVKDIQFIALKSSNFGGNPLISWRCLQWLTSRVQRLWNSLMHSGRCLKLFSRRNKLRTCANCMKPAEKNSSSRLQDKAENQSTFEGTIEPMLSSPSSDFTHCHPLQLVTLKSNKLGIVAMLLGKWTISHDKVKSSRPIRFWNEGGNSLMGSSSIQVPLCFPSFLVFLEISRDWNNMKVLVFQE